MTQNRTATRTHRSDRSPWNWLLLVAAVMPLLTFVYNSDRPRLAGIPFFYWFQLALVVFASLCATCVYLMTGRGGPNREH
ncbi:DUF3311 domain-containing protein [Streptomyces sp. NPDC047000]|uniref:DUF3311 domain-containing protein n=1 Tax=Streptomyces sp. NPDC047000 TaxID=3155474 RepID=UPI0033F8A9CB